MPCANSLSRIAALSIVALSYLNVGCFVDAKAPMGRCYLAVTCKLGEAVTCSIDRANNYPTFDDFSSCCKAFPPGDSNRNSVCNSYSQSSPQDQQETKVTKDTKDKDEDENSSEMDDIYAKYASYDDSNAADASQDKKADASQGKKADASQNTHKQQENPSKEMAGYREVTEDSQVEVVGQDRVDESLSPSELLKLMDNGNGSSHCYVPNFRSCDILYASETCLYTDNFHIFNTKDECCQVYRTLDGCQIYEAEKEGN